MNFYFNMSSLNRLSLFLALFFTFYLSSLEFGQAQDPELDEDYISEFIYGVNLNTNGGLLGGFMLKGTKIVKPKVYRSLGLELVGVKNPKEDRFSTPSGNSFIFGKKNYLYSLRMQYGRDIVLFGKAPEEGVQVSANFAAGPSLGFEVPYYVQYAYEGDLNQIRSEPYDPVKHEFIGYIYAPGGFLQGIGEAKIIPGINAKVGLSLDFGTFRNSISGAEVGFSFEAYTRAPQIMTNPDNSSDLAVKNQQFFTAAYLTFFFGSRK